MSNTTFIQFVRTIKCKNLELFFHLGWFLVRDLEQAVVDVIELVAGDVGLSKGHPLYHGSIQELVLPLYV